MRVLELVQVKGQRRTRQAELFTNMPGRQAVRASLDQQPKYIEPSFLRESRQGGDDINFLHFSTYVETLVSVNKET